MCPCPLWHHRSFRSRATHTLWKWGWTFPHFLAAKNNKIANLKVICVLFWQFSKQYFRFVFYFLWLGLNPTTEALQQWICRIHRGYRLTRSVSTQQAEPEGAPAEDEASVEAAHESPPQQNPTDNQDEAEPMEQEESVAVVQEESEPEPQVTSRCFILFSHVYIN